MGEGLELRPVNVLIGANGTGKSNLVAFFSLLNHITTDNLSEWIAHHGILYDQLYYGPKVAHQFEVTLSYAVGETTDLYHAVLNYAPPGNLLLNEKLEFCNGSNGARTEDRLEPATNRSALRFYDGADASPAATAARSLLAVLACTKSYHFLDTSSTARVKKQWRLADNASLKSDGGNLAPVLHRLKEAHPDYYRRIVGVIRQVVPFFSDFELKPEPPSEDERVTLQWREKNSDMVFGPHQLSDGTLRFMMLATLLLLPAEPQPRVVIIDEPELGLHPAAIEALGSMVYTATSWTQVILTTQSTALLDVFEAEDVVVVSRVREENTGRYETQFHRLTEAELEAWEDYSLSELWEKNVIEGSPMA
jgi:predicted ATPase